VSLYLLIITVIDTFYLYFILVVTFCIECATLYTIFTNHLMIGVIQQIL